MPSRWRARCAAWPVRTPTACPTTCAAAKGSNEPLPFRDVEPVLRDVLGEHGRDLLPELDDRAAAAASLGQVHRGRWHDGRDVAVNVQYPGVCEALAADVRTCRR